MAIVSSPERALLLLFTQLTWPSAMVRERACTAIAELMSNVEYGELTRHYLLAWMTEQNLESVSALGLLVVVRAAECFSNPNLPTASDLASTLSSPSILSWMLLQEFAPPTVDPMEAHLRHSGHAPNGFVPSPFYVKYVRSFLPPIYDIIAEKIDRTEGIPFRRQWAFEWEKTLECTGREPSTKGVDFWLGRRDGEERYLSVDFELSEVYRSAYLRALAWAIDQGFLSSEDGLALARKSCPVDLELWQLNPKRRPQWWPRAEEPSGKIDTVGPSIWRQVEDLAGKQQRGERWGTNSGVGDDQILVNASGRVHEGSVIYDLEIFGVFQKSDGPTEPDPKEVVDWLCGEDRGGNSAQYRLRAPGLRFKGLLDRPELNSFAQGFADWSFVPAASGAMPSSRWQAWRMFRSIWLPNPWLSEGPLTLECADGSLLTRAGDQVVARWNDWTDGLSEKTIDNVGPVSGQYLTVPRCLIDHFAAETRSTFCWFCRLKGHARERSYEPYKTFSDHREFGARRIVL